MASFSLCPQFETNLMSNRKVIELLLQLKSAKAYGKSCKKFKPHLLRHLLRNRLQLRVANLRTCSITKALQNLSHIHCILDDKPTSSPRHLLPFHKRLHAVSCDAVHLEQEHKWP